MALLLVNDGAWCCFHKISSPTSNFYHFRASKKFKKKSVPPTKTHLYVHLINQIHNTEVLHSPWRISARKVTTFLFKLNAPFLQGHVFSSFSWGKSGSWFTPPFLHPISEEFLVGGFNQPIWKIWLQIGFIFPKVRGENKKYLSCHHLDK